MLYEYLKHFMLKNPLQIIEDENESITYKELMEFAESFGKELNFGKYGILCRSDLDTAKFLMACLYARKTAVLLSYKYGEIHNKKIIENIQLSYILNENGVEKISEEKPEVEDLSDVSLILSTSGTTGLSKGVMLTENNLMTNLNDIADYFGISNTDHIMIIRPLYHCAVLTGEFFISLIKGLHISFRSDGFSPMDILHDINSKTVTVMCGTPTLFYHLANMNIRSKSPVSLRVAAISGECMTKIVAERIRKAFKRTKIYNVYGLTEASPRVCYLPPEQFDEYPLSVGYPLASLKVNISDNELLIYGKSVMKGYYNNPEETKKAVKDDWLYTKDVAEIDNYGRIYIKCRKDNMIIRSGMNIYPQEIENSLKQDSRISDVLAYGIKNDTISEKIGINVVSDLSESEIYKICKEILPNYQIPDMIKIVEEIPRNASGKIIRNRPEI